MTIYEQMTRTIESFKKTAAEIEEKDGGHCDYVRGMAEGVEFVRDHLCDEAKNLEVPF